MEYYSESRALDIAEELLDFPISLALFPQRGSIEANLHGRQSQFRYILYRRTNTATVKIIYYIDELNQTVYVTDFFPTEMVETKIKDRS